MHKLLIAALLLATANLHAQAYLDPTRNVTPEPQTHTPLPEQYLWTANDITVQRPDHNKFPWNRPLLRIDPHFFRANFNVAAIPKAATVYIAGPRSAGIWINGKLAGTFTSDIDAPIGFHVFHADVTAFLRPGSNLIAIEAIRGRGIVAGGSNSTQQIAYGEILAAKIIPATFGIEAAPLVISTPAWKSTATLIPEWQSPKINDMSWPAAATLGPIESDPNLMQWNADAGMYEWPGFLGISPNLRTLPVAPLAATHIYEGVARLSPFVPGQPFTVANLTPTTDSESPAILLDFGKEIAGRLLLQSASACESTLSVTYGESEIEALATGLTPGQKGGNYLGTNLLDVPQSGIARGPKSAFRYVRIRFLRGCSTLVFPKIEAEAIFYPVTYAGSFESSDPLLDRIWETGAYTAHLCMQDGIWDAPKRDRGRWVGDLDIEGTVISTAFGDSAMTEDTLRRLADETSPAQHVNGIPSYSALWLTSLESLYNHSGDEPFLESQHIHILQILGRLDQDIDATNLLNPTLKGWEFVDWAPSMYGATPEARIGTNLQYLRGFNAGYRLLKELNDPAAERYRQRAALLTDAAQTAYVNRTKLTIGTSWQLNALGILTLNNAISVTSLSHIKQDDPSDPVISPYFNAYLLDALAILNHRTEALDWIRAYWGGMLAEGATSFWESYDLRWPKDNYHLSLQADGTSGFFVSLAHGWSAGPTAWLSENVLGVRDPEAGFRTVTVAPNLLGLDYAKGTVPTPHGPISVAVDKTNGLTLDLPADITANVSYEGHSATYAKAGHYTLPAR